MANDRFEDELAARLSESKPIRAGHFGKTALTADINIFAGACTGA
jgi:hypothetical protein